ncbi:MAG TPA: serine hydrolase [Ruminiclostridium sp.]
METTKLPRALPHEMGVDPKAILSFVNTVEDQQLGIHSFMLLRHNKVVAEGWWDPMKPSYNHILFSLSKSFTSTAIGFAVQEKLLSIEDYVLSFFPDKLPYEPCENMKKMKIKHLLNMCTGHSAEPPFILGENTSKDWVYSFLTSYVDLEPGSLFVYNTPATYMLSAILQEITKSTTFEFLQPRLFQPLGISDIWWEVCPKGINAGGFGLNIKTEDIAKFGTFLLNKGVWEGKQLLNSAWIEEATAKHIENNGDTPDWKQGYGYQFWRCQPEGVYRGDGAFGQYCIVMPEQDAVIAIQAGVADMQKVLTDIWDILLPAMKNSVPENKENQTALEEKLSCLVYSMPSGEARSPMADIVSGKEYEIAENSTGITKLAFNFADTNKVTVHMGENNYTAEIGYQKWIDGQTHFKEEDEKIFSPLFHHISCAGAWVNEDTFQFDILYNRTTTKDTFEIKFHEKGITIMYERKLNFTGGKLKLLGW